MFLLEPPPGFKGLDPNNEVTIYHRHLPHWRQKGATYFERPFDGDYRLEDVLKSRKLWTSRRINEALGRSGTLWQQESYDRILRDAEHLWKVLQYIGKNPRLAGIGEEQSTRWVRPDWMDLGWKFVDEV